MPAFGTEQTVIAIISSQDTLPYRQTITGFDSVIKDARPDFDIIRLGTDFAALAPASPSLVLALGIRAARHANTSMPDTPGISTMILGKAGIPLGPYSRAVLLGISPRAQLEWHKKILPRVKRLGLIFDPEINQAWVDEARPVATSLGLELIAIPIHSVIDLPAALKVLGRNADSILGIADATVYSSETVRTVLLFSFRNRIPLVGLSRAWVKAGALYALDWDYLKLGQQSAAMALQLLDGSPGTSISSQPQQTPQYFINLKTARQMKLEFSQALLDGAAEVYK